MSASDLIATLSGAGPAIAGSLAEREEIMRLSQASHDAVLLPREPGGLDHAERAALAARMARHNREPELETHYRRLLLRAGETPALAAIAEAAEFTAIDGRLRAVIRHADMVTLTPRDATKADIAALVAAGVSETDIVRLAELIAFVNYQARVIAGLRLLEAAR